MSATGPRLNRTKKVAEPQTQIVPLGWARVPLTKNQQRRMNHYAEANLKRIVMAEVRSACRNAGTKPVERALVRLVYRPGTKRLCDTDGLSPTLSMCLDALVHEGILRDDNLLFVFESATRIWPPLKGLPAAFWLELEPIPDEEDAA